MVRLLRKLHRLWYLFSVLFFFILFFPILYPLSKNPAKHYVAIAKIRRWIALLGTTFSGISFKVDFEIPIDWSKTYVICPNHTSILDITAICFICPQAFSFMGKIELLKNPVTRIFFKSIDIVVDRKSKISAFKAFKKADNLLKTGKSVVIFPEGKIDDEYPPRLHQFKSGSFKLAIDNQIPILPVVIENAWKLLWDGGERFGSRPGTVRLHVLSPIHTNSLAESQIDEIQSFVYEKMNAHWSSENGLNNVKNKKQQITNDLKTIT